MHVFCRAKNVALYAIYQMYGYSLEGGGRVKGLGGCWKFMWGWLIVERGWGRVKGLGRCWKFKWGWLIVERGWRRVKGLGGCCKFE